MGCSPVLAFGTALPERTISMVCYWPVGGVKYRLSAHQRVAEHLGFVSEHGLEGVVAHVQREGKHFGADPRGGPWASVIKTDPAFAAAYAKLDLAAYKVTVAGIARTLFDRDTAPGAEPEDLMRLDRPGTRHPRTRRRARDVGRALRRRMSPARGVLGRHAPGTNTRQHPATHPGISGRAPLMPLSGARARGMSLT